MSLMAFPVLVRILSDRGLFGTPLGSLALGAGAVGDVLAWSLIAAVLALVTASAAHAWRLVLIGRSRRCSPSRADHSCCGRSGPALLSTVFSVSQISLVVAAVLLAGAATEWMGLHYVFGASARGYAMPRDPGSARRWPSRSRA